MLDEQSFNELVDEIRRQGFDEARASQVAALIGDTPEFDEQGLVVVMDDHGGVIARLRLRFFED